MTDAQQEYAPEQVEASRRQEETMLQSNALSYLQNRTVLLNLEVGKRDEKIAEQASLIAELEEALNQAHERAASAVSERRRETPETVKGEVESDSADTDM